jgi:hypothetical protein
MEEQIQEYLYNPTGKIVSFLIGIAVIWMLIKAIQKNLFLKLRTIIIGIKLKFSSFIGYFLTIILLTVVFSKLGNLTVALGVAGAGIALHFK